MKNALAAMVVVGATSLAFAQPPGVTDPASYETSSASNDSDGPPLSGGRVAGELFAGAAVGAGGLLLGVLGGIELAAATGCHNEMCRDRYIEIAGAAGLVTAAPLAVHAIGSIGDQTGSLAATYAGSVAGGILGLVLLEYSGGNETAGWVAVSAPLVGAVIGSNLTRRYERTPPARSWVPTAQVTGERTTFGVVGRF